MNGMAPKIIISLTSYPARIETVSIVIRSLLAQTVKPWKIILWLAKEEFPEQELSLPPELVALTRSTVFVIDWCENIRSYKKLIPALRKYPDCAIVTADDDIFYPNNLLENLLVSYQANTSAVHAMRTHLIVSTHGKIAPYRDWIMEVNGLVSTNDLLPTSGAGVLYPPASLDPRVTDTTLAMRLCPGQDDLWFWAMALLHGTRIQAVPRGYSLQWIAGTQDGGLCHANVEGGDNDAALKRLFDYFPELKDKVRPLRRPLPLSFQRFRGMISGRREGKRNYSLRLSVPLFQMKYSEDFSTLTYYILRIPIFRKRYAVEPSGRPRS